jgi:hypothetical protein
MTVLQGAPEPGIPVQAARAALLRPCGLPGAHRARGRVAVHAAAPGLRGLQDDTVLPECHVTAETDPAPQVAASRAERGIVCPSRAAQSAAVRTVRATSVQPHPSLLRQRPRRGVSAPGGA